MSTSAGIGNLIMEMLEVGGNGAHGRVPVYERWGKILKERDFWDGEAEQPERTQTEKSRAAS
jgi:hypothetical protein